MDAEAWDRRYVGSDLLWSVEPNRFLVAEVSGMEPGRALDVGTGEGRNAVWLAEQGWSVTGVDFSSVGLDKARARLSGYLGVVGAGGRAKRPGDSSRRSTARYSPSIRGLHATKRG